MTVAVDVEGRRVRARSCDVDTGWVPDPAMRAAGTAAGTVETAAGTLTYRVPLRGAGRGLATLGDLQVRSEVVSPVPAGPRRTLPGAGALTAELEAVLAASQTNGGSVIVRDLSGPGPEAQLSVGGQEQYQAASLIKLQILVELGAASHDVGFILVPGREISVSVLTDGPRTPTGNELVQNLVRVVSDHLVAS